MECKLLCLDYSRDEKSPITTLRTIEQVKTSYCNRFAQSVPGAVSRMLSSTPTFLEATSIEGGVGILGRYALQSAANTSWSLCSDPYR